MSEAAVLYESNLPLIYERVNSFSRSTGRDERDLFSAAEEAFMEAVKKWNPAKGPFGTFLGYKLTHRLARHAQKNPLAIEPPEELGHEHSPDIRRFEFLDSLTGVTGEAKEVLDIVFASGEDILSVASSPREARGMLRDMLEDMGWSCNKISKTFKTIETFLKSR